MRSRHCRRCAARALDGDRAVPAAAYQLREPEGVVGVGLVQLAGEHRLGVAGVQADHWQALLPQAMPEPGRKRAGLQPDGRGRRRPGPHRRGDALDLARAPPAPDHRTVLVDHADRRPFQADVQADILHHGCSPWLEAFVQLVVQRRAAARNYAMWESVAAPESRGGDEAVGRRRGPACDEQECEPGSSEGKYREKRDRRTVPTAAAPTREGIRTERRRPSRRARSDPSDCHRGR